MFDFIPIKTRLIQSDPLHLLLENVLV